MEEVVEGGRDFAENSGGGGWDLVFQKNLLRENFGGFEAGSVGFRAVCGNSHFQKFVDETERKGNFRSDHDKFNFLPLREGNKTGDVIDGNGEARHFLGDARITRCADESQLGRPFDPVLRERLDERMFAPAGTDNEEGRRKSH